MAKLFIIIQARMTSTRLPKKVLLPLCGRTVLEVMLDRLSSYTDSIIIATTNDGSEKPIVELCKKLDIKYYRGDTNDVLSRYYEAAVEFGAKDGDVIVRLTGDCPLIDENVLSRMIEFYHNNSFEYVSNCIKCTFPRGLDVEIFSFELLRKADENITTLSEKEHVTPYIKSHTRVGSFVNNYDNSKYRLTLDEEDDYLAIQEVYKKLDCRVDFSYEELIYVLEKNPHIYEINAHIEQKKV